MSQDVTTKPAKVEAEAEKELSPDEKRHNIQRAIMFECRFGQFWPFKVFGSRYDGPSAMMARTDELLLRFESYLREKYSDEWLTDIVDTEDDCDFLRSRRETIAKLNMKTEEEQLEEFAAEERSRYKNLHKDMSKEEFDKLLESDLDTLLFGETFTTDESMVEPVVEEKWNVKTKKVKKTKKTKK